jgi:hypothetical protein
MDRYSWVPFQASQERTRALVLIESALCYLARERQPLLMEQGGSKTDPTILLGYTGDHLLVESPSDWQLQTTSARFHYKNLDQINCYFDTSIDFIKEGVIHAHIPEYLVRQQRRAHPRVEVPGGSEAVFFEEDGGQARLVIKNLSAAGMLCCGRSDRIAVGSTLQGIDLLLASPVAGERIWYAELVNVPQGRVVRTFTDDGSGLFYYGIAFDCGNREKENLLKYVWQREIALAGMAASN